MVGPRFCLLMTLGVLAAGCASAPEQADPNAPMGCVVIDNSKGGGRHARIFLEPETGGSGEFMGEVGAGRTLRFCTRRFSLPRSVRVVIQRPSTEQMDPALGENQPRPIRSGVFVLNPWDEWTWEVSLNRLVQTPNGARGGG